MVAKYKKIFVCSLRGNWNEATAPQHVPVYVSLKSLEWSLQQKWNRFLAIYIYILWFSTWKWSWSLAFCVTKSCWLIRMDSAHLL